MTKTSERAVVAARDFSQEEFTTVPGSPQAWAMYVGRLAAVLTAFAAEAVKAEREACAKLAVEGWEDLDECDEETRRRVAADIRARS